MVPVAVGGGCTDGDAAARTAVVGEDVRTGPARYDVIGASLQTDGRLDACAFEPIFDGDGIAAAICDCSAIFIDSVNLHEIVAAIEVQGVVDSDWRTCK